MLEESSRLGRLVESLLNIARADAGQLDIRLAPVPLLSFAQEALSLVAVLAEEKSQRFSISGESAAEVCVDRVLLQQILINLVDNAVKYTPSCGSISVTISRPDELTVSLEVEDSEPGIHQEHQDKIFERFYRTDEARSREAGGVGLGLAVAKWATEALGGQLKLDTASPSGSWFRLTLPAHRTNGDGGKRQEPGGKRLVC